MIDHTEFVSVTEGTLLFQDPKQQANFELGVSMIIHSWDSLKVAVDNQWGGPNSDEKRDWITSVIVELFSKEKAVDISVIEETLMYIMADEFDVDLEDESALYTGKRIIDLYKECFAKNYDNVKQMYERWQQRQKQRAVNRVVVGEDPNNPDASDDEEEDDDEEMQDQEMTPAEEQSSIGPIIDDDGFELVSRRRR